MLFQIYKFAEKILSPLVLQNLVLKLFGLIKIPMIGFCSAKLIEFNEHVVRLKVPLNRRTRNHLNSIYFGALAVGADLTGGVIAIHAIYSRGKNIQFVFKDMFAEFLKRAEGDTIFTCTQVREVFAATEKALNSSERVNVVFDVIATVPSKLGSEPVAKFKMTLSLKSKP